MVSIEQTSRKYRGRKAATYDEIRVRQARWHLENETIARWLHEMRPSSVLDCPVGTGRFMCHYADLACTCLKELIGVDASDEMLALARKKAPLSMRRLVTLRLDVGDAPNLPVVGNGVDEVVCVRFLDLMDEEAMRAVVRELCRAARRAVLLTIRLGDEYVPKVNTATHGRGKFLSLVSRLGWRVADSVPFRDAGWTIIRLERKR